MTDPIYVSNYGVHRTSQGLVWLHQGSKKFCNFVGLAEQSPFEVVTYGKQKVCPHRINNSVPMPDKLQWLEFLAIVRDPLGSKFLPIPRDMGDKIPFTSELDERMILTLSTMCSPVYPIVHRYDMMKIDVFESLMQLTNVAPLIITDWHFEKQALLEEYVSIARRSPRRAIMAGDRKVVMRHGLEKPPTNLPVMDEKVLYSLPMESLGAAALRRWARGEQIDSMWER